MTRRRNPPNGQLLAQSWVQTILSILAMFGSMFWVFNQLDKRLTVMETKMEIAFIARSAYVTKDEVEQRMKLEEEQHKHLQEEIDDLKKIRR